MAVTPMEDLLSVDTLTGLVRTFSNQAENRACSSVFASQAKPIKPAGTSAKWEQVEFSRHFAPVTGVESPHPQARRLGLKERASPMAMIKAYKDLPSSHLFLRRAPGQDTSEAEAILADELLDLVNLIENTKEFLACSTLLGRLRVSKDTVPGAEVEFDLDWEVPELNSSDWSQENTKLRSKEFAKIKKLFKDQSGRRAGSIVLSSDAEGWLVANKEIKDFAKEVLGLQILQGGNAPSNTQHWNGLGGLSWHFTDGTYKPEGEAVRQYWPTHQAMVLPEPAALRKVLGWAEGRVFVPAGSVFALAEQATGLIREARGYYAYAKLRDDPTGIRIYAGWYGLPVLLNPQALLRLQIAPPPRP